MIHLSCPICGARNRREGFRVRGQFCYCGWSRDMPRTALTDELSPQAKTVLDASMIISASPPPIRHRESIALPLLAAPGEGE